MSSQVRRKASKLEIIPDTDELLNEAVPLDSPSRSMSSEVKRIVRAYYRYPLFGFVAVLLFCLRRVAIPGVDGVIQMWPVCLVSVAPLLYAIRTMHLSNYSTSYWLVTGFVLLVGIMYSIFCGALAVKGLALQFTTVGLIAGCFQGISLYLLDRFTGRSDNSISWCLKVSAVWVALEWAFSLVVGTFFCLGTPFGVVPFFLQPIKILGSFSLEFLLVFNNAAIACAALKDKSGLIPASMTWLLWIGFSIILTVTMTSSAHVTVAVVSTPLMNHRTKASSHYFDASLATARSIAASDKPPELIVLPEKWVFAETLDESTPATVSACEGKVRQLFNPTKSAFIVGCKTKGRGNFAVIFTREGIKVYGKQNPMILINEKSKHKTGFPVFDLPNHSGRKFSSIICFDGDFPATFASAVEDPNVDLVATPSGDWTGVRDHYLVSVFRAVEFGVTVARADEGFNGAVINPDGSLLYLKESYDGSPNSGIVKAELPGNALTFFRLIWPHTFPVLCLVAVIVMVFLRLFGLRN